MGEQKLSKWHNMARYQEVIAICSLTSEHRMKLLDEAEPAAKTHNCKRFGTDLRSLFSQE